MSLRPDGLYSKTLLQKFKARRQQGRGDDCTPSECWTPVPEGHALPHPLKKQKLKPDFFIYSRSCSQGIIGNILSFAVFLCF
jgi:hypothetical protein